MPGYSEAGQNVILDCINVVQKIPEPKKVPFEEPNYQAMLEDCRKDLEFQLEVRDGLERKVQDLKEHNCYLQGFKQAMEMVFREGVC